MTGATVFDSSYRNWRRTEAQDSRALVAAQDTPQYIAAFWRYATSMNSTTFGGAEQFAFVEDVGAA